MSTASQQPPVTLAVPEGSKKIADSLEQDRFHLVLGVSPEVNQIIEQLALRYRTDKAGVLNLSVGFLKYISDEVVLNGKQVVLTSPSGEPDTEITGLAPA